MFVTKKLFNRFLKALGVGINCYGIFYVNSSNTSQLGHLNQKIKKLETKLRILTDYLKLEYKTETTEELPRFVKKIGKGSPEKEEKK